jgi:hypothetical protein
VLTRIAAIVTLVLLLVGATNSSNSVFRFEFADSTVSAEKSIPIAVATLESLGFHRTSQDAVVFQYANSAIWAEISVPSDGKFALSLSQLRGGCGRNRVVSGANEAAAKLLAAFEQHFGKVSIKAKHAANTGA